MILNYDFLKKGVEIVSRPDFAYDFSLHKLCYILLIIQISLSECLNFLRYWAICVLQLFSFQVVMS